MLQKIIAVIFVLFITNRIVAQGTFYNLNTIQRIEITFTQTNWDYMLDTAANGSQGYIMAKKVKINNTEFDSVGVKYKGNSSYNANQVKNPFHIELDTYKDQNYEGYTDIKLGNGFKDPSFLREVLSYKIVRNYMPAPQSNYANVYVNNTLIGLYTNSESIGKKFADEHFGSKSNTFIKCNPPAGAGPGSTNLPNLVYLGTDSAQYYSRYELQSDFGWRVLINLCDTLVYHSTAIENAINVNQALWMLAFDNVLVNLDSYIGQFAQNYYLYEDDFSRFKPVVWDLNESFGTFSMTGTSNLTTTLAKQQMTYLLHVNDAGWPLIKQLLAVPIYKRMYVADMKTILAENIANNTYYTDGLALQELIKTSVNADPNKFFTYENFLSNLTTDVNIGNGLASGLTNLMNSRNTYLSAQSDFTAAQPVISSITVSDTHPLVGSSVTITARITNVLSSGAYLCYRSSTFAPFQRISMFDDGAHGDGTAGDGIFGALIPVSSLKTDYYFYAENSSAGIFAPLRAEVEFYTITGQSSGSYPLVINEFLASNSTTAADPNGEFDDWIEIYNYSTGSIVLDNMYLSDKYTNLQKWNFPSGTVIQPNSYLIVWADEDGSQPGLHANFKLSGSGEEIVLSHTTAGIIDSLSFGVQSTDISMQRCPDHTGSFLFASPSFNKANNCMTGIYEPATTHRFSVYPNPCLQKVKVSSDGAIIRSIRLVNMMGQSVLAINGNYTGHQELNLEELPRGLYLIIVNDSCVQKIIKN